MLREILKNKLAEDIPEEMEIDFTPLARGQIAEHFIIEFLKRKEYDSVDKCLKNYAYMLTSIILSWRAKSIGKSVTIN